jgi:hypothetical protein
MASYTRQSSFADGDIIQASDFNDEFNQLVNAFANTSGHKHDGTAAEGPVIGLIGDPGVATPLNKVVVDDTNNRIGVFVDVSGTTTEQLRFQDGAILPVTTNDVDIGSSSLKFKDLHLAGTANIAGTVTLSGNVLVSGTLGADLIPDADDTRDIGSTSAEWKDLYIDGTAYVDAINLNGTAITSTAAELNILDGVTATATELNILDGVTSTTAELNILDGVTSTATELNILDGVTATTAELNILDGVTSTAAELNLLDGVTSTTAELNIVDGSTTATATTVAAADRVVLNDNGTMVQAAVTDLDTFFSGTTKTLTNKTLTSAVLNGTISGTSIKDEDDMSSDSASHLATQQSIKAYVDTQIAGIDEVVEDTTPQLGGDLDVNGNSIVSASNGNIAITPNGTGSVVIDGLSHPQADGSAGQFLKTDGSGQLAFASVTGATGNELENVVEDTTPQLGGDLDVNTNNISFGDSTTAGTDDTLMFGAGDDLKLYHDGTHSYIHDSGTGDLRLRGSIISLRSENNNVPFISAASTGVTLTHAGATKLTTVSTGVDVTGSLDVTDASTTRTNLGLAIGTDVQAYDAELAALAGLTSAADKGIQFTGSGTAATFDLTTAGKALLDDASASAQRTTLGLGTAATQDTGTSASNVVQLDGSARLPAVDGSQLTNLPASGDGGIAMAIALG